MNPAKMRLTAAMLLFLIAGAAVRVFAQVQVYEDFVPEKSHLYMKERFVYGSIHTAGGTLGFEQGWLTRKFRYHGWNVELATQLNPKAKAVNYYGTGRSYKYGMLNSVCVMRAGYGGLIVLNEKPYWGGVQLSFSYKGGLSLAFAFPQWVYVLYDDRGEEVKLEKMDADNPRHREVSYVLARSRILRGFKGMRPYPGLFARAGLDFEFGKTEEFSHTLGFGVTFDGYFQRIPLMMRSGPRRDLVNFSDPFFFLNFYIEYKFGMRYGKR